MTSTIQLFLNNGECSLADTLIEKTPIVLDPSMVEKLNNWVKQLGQTTTTTMKLTIDYVLRDITKLKANLLLSEQEFPALLDIVNSIDEVHFCYFYPESAKLIMSVPTRAMFAPIRALHKGVWQKDIDPDRCTYRATLDSGVEIVCEVRELPPSCTIVEETIDVPAKEAHTITKRKVKCAPTKEELAASEASQVKATLS